MLTQTHITVDEHGMQASIVQDEHGTAWLMLGPEGVNPWSQATTGVRLRDVQKLLTQQEQSHVDSKAVSDAAKHAPDKLAEIRRRIREERAGMVAGPLTRQLLLDVLDICEAYGRENAALRNTLQRTEQALDAARGSEK